MQMIGKPSDFFIIPWRGYQGAYSRGPSISSRLMLSTKTLLAIKSLWPSAVAPPLAIPLPC
jgi:hypothetical protein